MSHSLIEKLFRKRGIEDPNKLSVEEKQTFENWEKILSKDELTIGDIKKFCESQVEAIETRWKDMTIANGVKSELIPYHTTYKTLLLAFDSPRVARESLEIQLQQMLNT